MQRVYVILALPSWQKISHESLSDNIKFLKHLTDERVFVKTHYFNFRTPIFENSSLGTVVGDALRGLSFLITKTEQGATTAAIAEATHVEIGTALFDTAFLDAPALVP